MTLAVTLEDATDLGRAHRPRAVPELRPVCDRLATRLAQEAVERVVMPGGDEVHDEPAILDPLDGDGRPA